MKELVSDFGEPYGVRPWKAAWATVKARMNERREWNGLDKWTPYGEWRNADRRAWIKAARLSMDLDRNRNSTEWNVSRMADLPWQQIFSKPDANPWALIGRSLVKEVFENVEIYHLCRKLSLSYFKKSKRTICKLSLSHFKDLKEKRNRLWIWRRKNSRTER